MTSEKIENIIDQPLDSNQERKRDNIRTEEWEAQCGSWKVRHLKKKSF